MAGKVTIGGGGSVWWSSEQTPHNKNKKVTTSKQIDDDAVQGNNKGIKVTLYPEGAAAQVYWVEIWDNGSETVNVEVEWAVREPQLQSAE